MEPYRKKPGPQRKPNENIGTDNRILVFLKTKPEPIFPSNRISEFCVLLGPKTQWYRNTINNFIRYTTFKNCGVCDNIIKKIIYLLTTFLFLGGY